MNDEEKELIRTFANHCDSKRHQLAPGKKITWYELFQEKHGVNLDVYLETNRSDYSDKETA